jgi:voltage-gated potassium channel
MWRLRAVLLLMVAWIFLGAAGIAHTEKIPLGDALYFASITGLTIGYGDITAHTGAGRITAVLIGFMGVFYTGLIVAGAVEGVRKTLPMSDRGR